MKDDYDLSDAQRGAVLKAAPGKTRITIRLDEDIVDWFRQRVHEAGGGNYQTLINTALRQHVDAREPALADLVRRIVREELERARSR